MTTVAALAGRRIDAAEAREPRFPLANVARVRAAIAAVLRDQRVGALVCSAACGVDLIALDLAAERGIRCRIVLPFAAARFRATSVADRPGDWGPLFDRLVRAAQAAGDLVVIEPDGDDSAAYRTATATIISEAKALARGGELVAIAAWEGEPRGDNDHTEEFRRLAAAAGFRAFTVSTV